MSRNPHYEYKEVLKGESKTLVHVFVDRITGKRRGYLGTKEEAERQYLKDRHVESQCH